MARYTAIDSYAYHERAAIMTLAAESDGTLEAQGQMWSYQQANAEIGRLPYSIAATAAANGDWIPARLLCAREHDLHGLDCALELWDAIANEVEDARSMDSSR